MARARVETPTVPMWASAQACFDSLKSSKATPASSTQRAPIRFFDDQPYSRYIREQLENKDDDEGSGRKMFRPTYVAIGPRFHREDDLKQGQEWKRVAAWDFWEYSDQPFTALFKRVEEVADQARNCYSSTATAGFTDDDFTTMMFVDGCFLLQLIVMCAANFGNGGLIPVGSDGRDYNFGSALSQIESDTLLYDVFMVENQIPWVILRALMSIRPVHVMHFVDMVVAYYFDTQAAARPADHHLSANDYQPIHLLDLLCKRQIGGQASSAFTMDELFTNTQLEAVTLTSATQLLETGVCICPSRTPRFADIDFSSRQCSPFGQLSLPPIVLRHTTLGLLLNMLAFELLYPDNDTRSNVAGYLGMLSALMSREEDVRQLRRKGIIQTTLDDMEVIRLLRKLEPHTNGNKAELTTYLVRAKINGFFKKWGIWIEFHRFVYKNLKFLIAIGSFLSVSLSILKAILALPAGSSK